MVSKYMDAENIKFRDLDELNQATQFLHDNGVLLHYQDVALSDLYFLDPQWLCDMLAHVITIKPINGFVKSGRCLFFSFLIVFFMLISVIENWLVQLFS